MDLKFDELPKHSDGCPDVAVWSDFLRGDVDQVTLESLSQHLADCSRCLERVEEISSRPLQRDQTALHSPFINEPQFQRMVQRASQLVIQADTVTHHERLPSPTGHTESLPEQLGRFVVRDILGTGGFGRVYLADDPLLQRAVAIKVPRRESFESDGELSDFLNEARHAAALDHPGVVPIHDVITDANGRTLIVMKHIEGRPLSAKLRSERLTPVRAVTLMIQIAQAVHFAHERGFVHRDLKPSNILIDSHGRRPFPQRDRAELFEAIAHSEPQIESAAETAELDTISRRCLSKSATDRFATAEALAQELTLWKHRHFPEGWSRWRVGWRRNVAVIMVLLSILMAAALNRVQARRTELLTTLTQLKSAPANQIPKLVARLREVSASVDFVVRQPDPSDAAGRSRFAVARLALGDRRKETIGQLADNLQTTQADEIAAVVQTLHESDNIENLVHELVSRITDRGLSIEMRFRLAAALAGLAPDDAAWADLQAEVAGWLASRPEDDLPQWWPLFDSVGTTQLAEPLRQAMISIDLPSEVQLNATRTLARFLAEDVNQLASLVVMADTAEVPLLVEGMKPSGTTAIGRLRRLFDELLAQPRIVPADDLAPPTASDIQASRLAVALWMLGEPNAICKSLWHDPNPTLQTLVIHGLAQQAITTNTVIDVLRRHQTQHDERSAAIKFGLLQVLGLLPVRAVRPQLSVKWLNEIWQTDPDNGVHSTAGWLAKRLEYELLKPDAGEHSRWLFDQTDNFEQTFAIVEPHVVELGIHRLDQAPVLTTPWPRHQRRFPRRFAIATNEVTIAQFRRFDADYQKDRLELSASARDAAMMLMTPHLAYSFCNWLSDQFGFERCYELRSGAQELTPRADHLSLSGYRLPTDGEWECACRAGTATSRFFGQTEALVVQYSWLAETPGRATRNGAILSQPVGRLLPNRWGLFDTYGNAKELCNFAHSLVAQSEECTDEYDGADA